MQEKVKTPEGTKTFAQVLADAMKEGAKKAANRGDVRMAKEILDRVDGPVRQEVHTITEESIKVIEGVDDSLT